MPRMDNNDDLEWMRRDHTTATQTVVNGCSLDYFQDMFASLEKDVIALVLSECGDDVDIALEKLTLLSDSCHNDSKPHGSINNALHNSTSPESWSAFEQNYEIRDDNNYFNGLKTEDTDCVSEAEDVLYFASLDNKMDGDSSWIRRQSGLCDFQYPSTSNSRNQNESLQFVVPSFHNFGAKHVPRTSPTTSFVTRTAPFIVQRRKSETDDPSYLSTNSLNNVENGFSSVSTSTDKTNVPHDAFHLLIATILHNIEKGNLVLIILRGLPGSGKSTLANQLKHDGQILSTDDYFICNGNYKYEPNKLPDAHEWNKMRASDAAKDKITPIIIDNTNVEPWEMKPYVMMGIRHGYNVEILEPNTPWKFHPRLLAAKNKHNVPKEKISLMLERYSHNVSVDDIVKDNNSKAKIDTTTLNKRFQQNLKASPLLERSASGSKIKSNSEDREFKSKTVKSEKLKSSELNIDNVKDVEKQLDVKIGEIEIKVSSANDLTWKSPQNFKKETSITNAATGNFCVWPHSEENFDWTEIPHTYTKLGLLESSEDAANYSPKPPRKQMEKSKGQKSPVKDTQVALLNVDVKKSLRTPESKKKLAANFDRAIETSPNTDDDRIDLETEEKESFSSMDDEFLISPPRAKEIEQLAKSLEEMIIGNNCALNLERSVSDEKTIPVSVNESRTDTRIQDSRTTEISTLKECFPFMSEIDLLNILKKSDWDIHQATNVVLDSGIVASKKLPSPSSVEQNETTMQSIAKDEILAIPKKSNERPEINYPLENKLVLKLDAKFAQQLRELFGTTDASNDKDTESGLEVCVDVEMAKQLYQNWIVTQQHITNERNRKELASYNEKNVIMQTEIDGNNSQSCWPKLVPDTRVNSTNLNVRGYPDLTEREDSEPRFSDTLIQMNDEDIVRLANG